MGDKMYIDVIVIVFFIVSIVFTFKYRFIQFKSFKETNNILVKKKSKTAYKTFMLSLASNIGTGNIVGISTCLIYGGPGSLFWMWLFAIFSSVLSLMENTLAQIYKVKINGEYRGGSSFYIRNGLNNKVIAYIIAGFLILTNTVLFQPLQVNTVSETIHIVFGTNKIIIFGCFIIFTILIIFNGTKRIVKFSEIIVPIMSIGYIFITTIIIIVNIKSIPGVISLIFKDAFKYQSIFGGFGSSCLLIGVKRSLFSHEAGLGTMPTISAMSEIKRPIEQGFIQVIGIFFDTIVLCSLTGIVILIYNMDLGAYSGYDIILKMFSIMLGDFGTYVGVFFLISFAIATVVSEYYLGESNLIFITKNKKGKIIGLLYKLLFCFGIFIGIFLSTNSIWIIVDTGMILIGILNVYSLIKMRKIFERELFKYYNC